MSFSLPSNMEYNVESAAVKQVSAEQVSAEQVSAEQVSAEAKPTFIDTRPECCTRHPQGYCEHARRGPTTSYTTPVEYDSDDEELMAFRSRNRF